MSSILVFSILVALLLLPQRDLSPAAAAPARPSRTLIPRSSPLPIGQRTLPPLAFVEFCQRVPAQCHSDADVPSVELTIERWDQLGIINKLVNEVIRPKADPLGTDNWESDTWSGDCDEFVIEKRHQLRLVGFPLSALSFAEVRDSAGSGHLVLLVHTDRGAYVLDNLRPAVLAWHATGYEFIKIQSPFHPMEWVNVDAERQDFGPRARNTVDSVGIPAR